MSVADAVVESSSPSWQWSLKELIATTTFIAVFFAMAAYMGFGNGLFWLCVIASSIITAACLSSLPFGRTALPGSLIIVIMLLLCNPILMFFSIVMAINGLLHLGLLARAKSRSENWTMKQVLLRSVSLTTIAFSVGVCVGYPRYTKFQFHKNQIQLTDLSERLEHEKSSRLQENNAAKLLRSISIEEAKIPGESEFEAAASSQSRFFGRVSALQSLHNGRIEMFVKSPGFGVGRFFVPSTEHTDYPVLQDFAFELLPKHQFREIESSISYYSRWSDQIVNKSSLHRKSVMNFVDPDSWGLIVGPQHAFGFRPHGFTLPPQNMGRDFLDQAGLALKRLELVSLLRFDSPRAYVLDHLPRMDQLVADDVATRELTRFEFASLKQLKNADELVRFQPTPDDGIEMVGAILAYQSCLECHNVRRGDMLGAFTYQFENAMGMSEVSNTKHNAAD